MRDQSPEWMGKSLIRIRPNPLAKNGKKAAAALDEKLIEARAKRAEIEKERIARRERVKVLAATGLTLPEIAIFVSARQAVILSDLRSLGLVVPNAKTGIKK